MEITATTLSKEFGLMPNKLPDTLDSIGLDNCNKYSTKVYSLISELFDMSTFNAVQIRILQIASLIAITPCDGKIFLRLLKESACADSEQIQTLIDAQWLTYDVQHSTFAIDTFLAEICLSKAAVSEELAAICLEEILSVLFSGFVSTSPAYIAQSLTLTESFFYGLKMQPLAELTKVFGGLSFRDEDIDATRVPLITARATSYAQNLSSALKDSVLEYISVLENIMQQLDILNHISPMKITDNLKNELFSNLTSVYTDEIKSLENMETSPEFETALKEFICLILDRNITGLFTQFFVLVNTAETLPEQDTDTTDLLYLILSQLCLFFVNLMKDDDDLICRFCATYYKIVNHIEDASFFPIASLFSVLQTHLIALCNCADIENAESVYNDLIDIFPTHLDCGISSDEKQFIDLWSHCAVFLKELAQANQPQKAETAFKKAFPFRFDHEKVYADILDAALSVFNAFLSSGDIDEACDFVENTLCPFFQAGSLAAFPDLQQQFDQLLQMQEQLEKREIAVSFEDKTAEYINYYKTFGDSFSETRRIKHYSAVADAASLFDFSAYSDEQLREKTAALLEQVQSKRDPSALMPEAFRLVSEAGFRVLGYRHHHVQYMGAAAIVDGKIAEIRNGEGKTYTILLAAFWHYLCGKQCHILDGSLFLTRRNYNWMSGVLELLGCRVQLLDSQNVQNVMAAKDADIIYSNIGDEGFVLIKRYFYKEYDCLRYDVAIVDEADQLMFDNGTKEILLNSSSKKEYSSAELFKAIEAVIHTIRSNPEAYLLIRNDDIRITREAYHLLYERLEAIPYAKQLTDKQTVRRIFQSAIYCNFQYELNKDYFFVRDEVYFEDSATGSFYQPNAYHQYFLLKKEGYAVNPPDEIDKTPIGIYTTIEVLDTFDSISGTTATAQSLKKEFEEHYGLEVIRIPSNEKPKSREYAAQVYYSMSAKCKAILRLCQTKVQSEQPILIIVENTLEARMMSQLFRQANIDHRLLTGFEEEKEEEILADAGKPGSVWQRKCLSTAAYPRKHCSAPSTLTPMTTNKTCFAKNTIV